MAAAGEHLSALLATASALATPGKGILAADESVGTMGKRLAAVGVENVESARQAFRTLLFASEGVEDAVSGVILFEETLYQKAPDGTPLVAMLRDKGVRFGVKVDKGVVPLPGGAAGETLTEGLDGLAARCTAYREVGATFTKWRAVLKIDGTVAPSELAVRQNARDLARFAAVSQSCGLVPIVEPEVLADGVHGVERCAAVTEDVLAAVFAALREQKVLLEGVLLKPNMATPGTASGAPAACADVAAHTLRALQRAVPAAVPGIFFLSGGQSEEDATANLQAINSAITIKPWYCSFSFGRALQTSALKAWQGRPRHVADAQNAFVARARANGQATLGQYDAAAALKKAG